MKSQALLILLAAFSALAQGTFQNLDFEDAQFTMDPNQQPGFVSAAAATPGWTPYVGTNATAILYNNFYLGTAVVDLFGLNYTNSPVVIDGSYSVVLQAGVGNSPGSPGGIAQTEVSIRQTGIVPVGAQSILFKARAGFMPLSVSLSGQTVPIFTLGTGSNYTLFSGDVSAFSGQTVELKFAALPPNSNWTIDSIEFSPIAIPEPSVLTLSALGTVLLIWRFLRRTRP